MEQYRQFFYCKRAEYLYSKLSPELRTDVRVLPNEEWVVKAIAYVLSHTVNPASKGVKRDTDIEEVNKPNSAKRWSCDESPLKSTYLRFALRYYQRAAEMDPYDNEASCGYAMVRQSLDPKDTWPIVLLGNTPAAHFARGNRLEATNHFVEALDEYETAIGQERDNVDALNNFAYTVYLWHIAASFQSGLNKFPDPGLYAEARANAAMATRLTANAGARIDHRIMLSTAGELELASGNPKNAVSLLEDSLKEDTGNPTGIMHPFFDEIRWDSAQAYTCAGAIPEAKKKLLAIREEEGGREDQRFVGPPDAGFIDENLKVLKQNCEYFKAQR
jgi:tetratricopeptide (TPR) repeat protein